MDDKNDSRKFPKGWVWTRLENITDIILGQSPPSSTYNLDKMGLPFYQGKAEFGEIYPAPVKWCSKPKKVAEKGDVLISVRAPVGPTNICPEQSCIGRGLAAIRPLGNMHSLFILYLIRSCENKLISKKTGTTFDAITGDRLRKFEIPLPPLPEQHRIVAKIEELFTKLDAGMVELKKVRSQLKLYRLAVLKYAFEGRITEEWRETHKDKLESASVLLEKIKEERKKKLGKKYKELPPLDTSNLPDVPDGWVWTRVNELFDVSYGLAEPLRKTVSDNKNDIPVIRIANITAYGTLDLSELKYFPLEIEQKRKLKLHKGDVLFNWRNSPKWLGKSAVFDQENEFVNASFLLRLRPYVIGYSKFATAWINHLRLTGYFLTKIENAVNQANFNANKTKQVEISFPPLPEQNKIMEEIEQRFSVADEVEKVIEQSLKKAERLRQSILKRAFEGKLVPQDPSDEPAEKLLELIKAEKAKKEAEKKAKKRRERKVNPRQMRLI